MVAVQTFRPIVVALMLTVAFITVISVRNQPTSFFAKQSDTNELSKRIDIVTKQSAKFAAQRNELSASLNRLQEKYQLLFCQSKQEPKVSESGGWCNIGVKTGHLTDGKLAKELEGLLSNKTVLGLGDGLGKYRRLLLDSGAVKKYDAFDGGPNVANVTNGQVSFLDLTLPQYWLPVYDWVIILEVIEHVSAKYEDIVLDNVVRAAGRGVILSWAVPGQGGLEHINCQPPEHVHSVMAKRNFTHDTVWTRKLQDAATLSWLKNNIMVFRRG